MKTIALRFADNFAPEIGTIAEHRRCISSDGFVWYGKLGSAVSDKVCREILANDEPRILLVHSGKSARYWAYIDEISKEIPDPKYIPKYYREKASSFKTWFKVRHIEDAGRNVMSNCVVISSGSPLSMASRHSMSPYFIIEC